jgi:hypothetical protein
MKVYIGPYTSDINPWSIASKIFFWKKGTEKGDDFIDRVGDWLSKNKKGEDSCFMNICNKLNKIIKRKIKVKIDPYDTWSADATLALIIHPVLKAVVDNKHGAPFVDDDDVPDELKSTNSPQLTEDEKACGYTDANWHKRWEWVLGEMIWTFEQYNINWEDQYYTGNTDYQFINCTLKPGPNHTLKIDRDGIEKHRERMDNGRRLFAEYYDGLWT